MFTNRILDPLNEAQRQAVTSAAPATLVLAGAGSGKTRVLTHRIAWLVEEQGVEPYSLLAVTFTNKAAAEMRGRVARLLDGRVQGLWVGTFHGLSHRLLRQHWQEAGLPQGFQIIDSDDQLRLVKRIVREAGLDETAWPPKQVRALINAWKEDGLRAAHVEETGDPNRQQVLELYRNYEELCRRSGLVDFTELLLRALELLRDNDALRAHYQQRFVQVLVDEFQDTNRLQYAWMRQLVGPQTAVFVVGDDDQSIYGWRGARVEHIRDFDRDFPDTEIVRLEQNYRSTGTILQAANAVIARNEGRLGKTLWTEGDAGSPIRFYHAFNEQDEAWFVIEQIRRACAEGLPRHEVAILYRSNAQSRLFEEALIRAGLPYRVYGGLRFFERAEVKDMLAYLRLIANRDDDAAFERVANVPPRGIGDKTIEQLRKQARDHGASLWQASILALSTGTLSPRASAALGKFTRLLESLAGDARHLTLQEQVDAVAEHSGLVEMHRGDRERERGETRIENIEELANAARGFRLDPEQHEGMTELDAFLSYASLEAGEGQGQSWEDCVQLMTLHSAKGLEFQLVFLVGLEEGLFPHQMALDEPGRLEEERRLCYVGITRARQRLVLTAAEYRRLHGRETFPMTSRFLGEIPDELIHDSRPKKRPAPKHAPRARPSEDSGAGGLSIGQRVAHAKFGAGIIVNAEGSGPSARVLVNFETGESKWLILSYA
ncbi:MAG: DNA helicase II, partial [Halothiobacillaceae bacterium]